MACLFMDSFDHYANTTQMLKKWTSVSGSSTIQPSAVGRNGTNGFLSQSGANAIQLPVKVLPSTYATLIIGVAFQPLASMTSDCIVLQLRDALAGGEQLSVRFQRSTNKLYVSRNGTTLAVGTTVLSYGVYYYVELKATIHNTVGAYEVHLNSSAEPNLTASGVNTRGIGTNNSADSVSCGGATGTNVPSAYWDDFYCCDTSGSVNIDFLGDVAIQCLLPNGDGANQQWTPSSGTTHYTLVDETTPNDDTDYVSDATAGDRDTYTYGDLRAATGNVLAVQVLIYARKDDAGTRQIAPVVRISGTNYDGATLPNLGTTYTWYPALYETSPASAAAWTVSEVNAAEFGVKLVA